MPFNGRLHEQDIIYFTLPLMGTLANSEAPDEMQHSAVFNQGLTVFVKVEKIFRQKIQYILQL